MKRNTVNTSHIFADILDRILGLFGLFSKFQFSFANNIKWPSFQVGQNNHSHSCLSEQTV